MRLLLTGELLTYLRFSHDQIRFASGWGFAFGIRTKLAILAGIGRRRYLLRSRKGHFYRKRYPTLAVV